MINLKTESKKYEELRKQAENSVSQIGKAAHGVAELKLKEENEIQNVESTIDSLKMKLQSVCDQLEATFENADLEAGEKLMSEKDFLQSRITYLKTYLGKRKEMTSVSEQEAEELLSGMKDAIREMFISDKERFESVLLPELKSMAENGKKAIEDAHANKFEIKKLRKEHDPGANSLGSFHGFYDWIMKFVDQYGWFVKNQYDEALKDGSSRYY